MDTVDQNDETLYYPVDIIASETLPRLCLIYSFSYFQIDHESTVWVLANKMPQVIYGHLNFEQNNFYILRANARELIKGTKCNLRDGIREDDCIRLFDKKT